MQAAREWLKQVDGPLTAAPWGKFTLALVGLYSWEGLNPITPELWLLPESAPFHPSRLWCHCRMVYLPMSYFYGKRQSTPEDAMTKALREELYAETYDAIDWERHRNRCAPSDTYVELTWLAKKAFDGLLKYEKKPSGRLRQNAIAHVLKQIQYEDENTEYVCLGPINKLLNALVWHFEQPRGEQLKRHIDRMPDYLYHAEDGVKMNGYNNSELWDTAFAVQAIMATGRQQEALPMLEKAHHYIEANQVLEDVPNPKLSYRHASKGGWPFSTRDHGWPISDCTSEGLKASLKLRGFVKDPISLERLTDAVDQILSMQNEDGGWATYELTRGPKWLEQLNPSMCFGDIMIDYSFVECTSACVQALQLFAAEHPSHPDTANQPSRAAWQGVHPEHPATRWILGGILGRVLHLRHVVWRLRACERRVSRQSRTPSKEPVDICCQCRTTTVAGGNPLKAVGNDATCRSRVRRS